jgi:hypothetical protein
MYDSSGKTTVPMPVAKSELHGQAKRDASKCIFAIGQT